MKKKKKVCAAGGVKNRVTCALLAGMWDGLATVETVRRFLKKLKLELPYDPIISHLGIYPKEL